MKKQLYIPWKYLPCRIPIGQTIGIATALKAWDAPQWLWGAGGFACILIWIVYFVWALNAAEMPDYKINR